MKIKDITGWRFGRLISLRVESRKPTAWFCKCDCGNSHIARIRHLMAGSIRSCGCLRRESSSERAKRQSATHGMSKTREYRTWQHMRTRCYDIGSDNYCRYGEKGIVVCARWNNSFEAFYEDMGVRPAGCSLDRKDNDANYSCGKCQECTGGQKIVDGQPLGSNRATQVERKTSLSAAKPNHSKHGLNN